MLNWQRSLWERDKGVAKRPGIGETMWVAQVHESNAII
jgi:hypothetical protein